MGGKTKKYIFEGISDPNNMVKVLKKFGCIVINNILSDVSELQKEIDIILDQTPDDGSYKPGKLAKLGAIQEQTQPERKNILTIFGSPFLKSIADLYLGENEFNRDIFVTNEYNEHNESFKHFHFNKIRALKFLMYATDVNCSNDGSFWFIPGSHMIGSSLRASVEQRNYYSAKNLLTDYSELHYYNDSEEHEEILGKAGTLIVFDTDVFHRGGNIKNNSERKVIRTHTWDKLTGENYGK